MILSNEEDCDFHTSPSVIKQLKISRLKRAGVWLR